MRYLSVCSGIEAASAAWQPLGWTPVAFSEIEPFPCSVLAHHHPAVPNWGDMTKFEEWPDEPIDLLCGGTPCQSFSVAGLRKGLADPRGNLMLTFGAIAAKYRPRWLVWENVPGVLSSNGGRDFGSFLGLLGELGYGFAYRVLDAQHFGVPQRRRRVFVVGCLGDWRAAAAVLFERHSLSGHPAPSREARQDAPAGAGDGTAFCVRPASHGAAWKGDGADNFIAQHAFGGNNTSGPINVATALNACASASGRMDFESETFIAHSLRGEGFDASEDGTGRCTPLVPVSVALRGRDGGATIEVGDDQAFALRASSGGGDKPHVLAYDYVMPTMLNGANTPAGHSARSGHSKDAYIVPTGMQVRRLTPTECERLQGFPDGHTSVLHNGKPAADGPRYKALGNSWAVNCARWIGERIDAVDAIVTQTGPANQRKPSIRAIS